MDGKISNYEIRNMMKYGQGLVNSDEGGISRSFISEIKAAPGPFQSQEFPSPPPEGEQDSSYK